MASLSEVEEHRQAVDDLSTLAVADLVSEWDALPFDDAAELSRVVAELLAEVYGDYGPLAASLGADFYDSLRSQAADLEETYRSILAEVDLKAADSLSDWTTAATGPDQSLARAAGGMQRLVANLDRSTIALNGQNDPERVRFARYASASACAFCAMTSLRGPVYRSMESAGGKYHDHCHCVAVPVWNQSEYVQAPYAAEWQAAYDNATAELGGSKNTKAILALMRDSAGLR